MKKRSRLKQYDIKDLLEGEDMIFIRVGKMSGRHECTSRTVYFLCKGVDERDNGLLMEQEITLQVTSKQETGMTVVLL